MTSKTRQAALTAIALIALLFGATHPALAGWDVVIQGVPVGELRADNYRELVLGGLASAAVHTAGHYAFAAAAGMSVRQSGLAEIVDETRYSSHRLRGFALAGFAAQHAVGTLLTVLPATRGTDFARGYTAWGLASTTMYPFFFRPAEIIIPVRPGVWWVERPPGDFAASAAHGGGDWEYWAFAAWAARNFVAAAGAEKLTYKALITNITYDMEGKNGDRN